ncbi:hypothetical protein C6370_04190 [Bacillus atrophaeus]|nr:hypothetical protein BaGK_06650 [Bacillus atrophaeus]ATO29569.1 hypothetical protein RA13_17480 [Bacillus atrophaeus]PRS07746.1 hypothetical protein C6W22_12775 [Bacillus atrophaeus]PSA92226.1 hypothetical protein C6371_09250 [Bacillus atrophaeus]PSA96543.1 hypothetical protein C6370_04190 [Bacillus atrophaeus]
MNITDYIVGHFLDPPHVILFIMKQILVTHHIALCANYRKKLYLIKEISLITFFSCLTLLKSRYVFLKKVPFVLVKTHFILVLNGFLKEVFYIWSIHLSLL